MPLVVVDEPPDRPDWIVETVALLAERLERERALVLGRVARASDAELSSGTVREWGIGQVAVHLFIIERGVLGIALRLARGETAGGTGQPRPAAAGVTRAASTPWPSAPGRRSRRSARTSRPPRTTG